MRPPTHPSLVLRYFDNAEICNMIDDPKAGMIAMLDEQCALSSGNDKSFLALLDKALAKNARYTSKQTGRSFAALQP